MTPQDTLPLVLEDELVRIAMTTDKQSVVNISGAIIKSVALNRIAGLKVRNPGIQLSTIPTEPPRRRVQ